VSRATLGSLITFAYGLKFYEIGKAGWSAWKSQQFDIVAKAEGDRVLTRDQFRHYSRHSWLRIQTEVPPRNEGGVRVYVYRWQERPTKSDRAQK
jgi:hypothetical protein